ncbi:hypothetical protein [Nonlabens dokdonensis]|uniref:hypothetical protein n=1 Tax=Nonlabens dokdonensis TaxID=328515 RepID=UPI0026EEB63D|nr:hypothetical protein [Nonlabens dokdonensis]
MIERIKVSANFYLDEFVDPYTFFNDSDHGLARLDKRIIDLAQEMRNDLGHSLRINNWWRYYKENSTLSHARLIRYIERSSFSKWSGYRSSRCTIGSRRSAHRTGQAIDPKGVEDIMFDIVKSKARVYYNLGLRRLEDPSITNGWLHMDTLERNTVPNSIRVVDLRKATQIIRF